MQQQFKQVQFVEINEDNLHQRIDNFLLSKLKGTPKSLIYRIIRKGEVRVNKKRIKPDYKLKLADTVRIPPIRLDDKPPQHIQNDRYDFIEQLILYEDERLLVVNKPHGMAVHGGSGINFGLIEVLRARRKENSYLELVHRLDRDTSGCILLAKKRSALRHLHQQLRDKTVDKTYHAVVAGSWPKKIKSVNVPLHKNQLKSGERMVFVDEQGKPSETKYRVLQSWHNASLLECKPITGRTHQIRVHCQHAGHAIGNDAKYGDKAFSETLHSLNCKRMLLHAKSISFIHPLSLQQIVLQADYDEAFSTVVKKLSSDKYLSANDIDVTHK